MCIASYSMYTLSHVYQLATTFLRLTTTETTSIPSQHAIVLNQPIILHRPTIGGIVAAVLVAICIVWNDCGPLE